MARNFIIVLQGGVVQDVVTTDPEMIGVGYDVVDYDTDGATREDEGVGYVDQSDGTTSDALIYSGYVAKSDIKILEKEDDETHASS